MSGKLTIHVDIERTGTDHFLRDAMEKQIKLALQNNDPDPSIEFVSDVPHNLQAGEILHVINRDQRNQFSGTIGTFVPLGKHKAAITCRHVVKEETNELKVTIGNKKHLFGSVVHMSEDFDFAVISIDSKIRKHVSFKIPKGDKEFSSSVLSRKTADGYPLLKNQEVYKCGAITGTTRGKIVAFPYPYSKFPKAKVALIESLVEDDIFSKHGDSGSIIYRMDPTDPDDDKIELIAMHVGAMPGSRDRNLYYAVHLEDAVEEANNTINLEFE